MSSEGATLGEEEYLQSLFWLQEAGLPMTGANVARAMQLSAPTVHEMVGRLERDEEHVAVRSAAGELLTLTPSVAETVSVLADPSPPPRTALPEQLVLGSRYGR